MKRLSLLDYSRFGAALMVVMFHYTFNGVINGKISSISEPLLVAGVTKYGYLGVELFFMISGYVIFNSASTSTATRFAVGRALRLFPAYWFAVCFTSGFAIFWGGDLMKVQPLQFFVNLTMLQAFLGVPHVDGAYWTLAYEITFYLAVYSVLAFGLQRYLRCFFLAWPALFLLAMATDNESLPLLGTYYYYFSAGTLFAALQQRFDWIALCSLFVTYLLCINYSTGAAAELSLVKRVNFSPTTIGFIISVFFGLFTVQISSFGRSLVLPLSSQLGALTYPIYLIHAHFGYMLINKIAVDDNAITALLLTLILVLLISQSIVKLVEQRPARYWRALFEFLVGRPTSAIQHFVSISIAETRRSRSRRKVNSEHD